MCFSAQRRMNSGADNKSVSACEALSARPMAFAVSSLKVAPSSCGASSRALRVLPRRCAAASAQAMRFSSAEEPSQSALVSGHPAGVAHSVASHVFLVHIFSIDTQETAAADK